LNQIANIGRLILAIVGSILRPYLFICQYFLIFVTHFFCEYCTGKHWANIRMNDHLEVKFAKQHKYWFYLVPILDVRGTLAAVCQYRPILAFCQYCQYWQIPILADIGVKWKSQYWRDNIKVILVSCWRDTYWPSNIGNYWSNVISNMGNVGWYWWHNEKTILAG
jgi:hypothetical protein